MKREWQAGDVAMLKIAFDDVTLRRLGFRDCDGWTDQTGATWSTDRVNARPLVVIDPEDRDQVAALLHAMRPGAANGFFNLQDALRSFIAPLKPDEPTGLGAVVEDAKGERWVRVEGAHLPWLGMVKGSALSVCYDEIAAVRVLSGGITS